MTILALLIVLVPALVSAQTNTTGSLSPTFSPTQAPTPPATITAPTTPAPAPTAATTATPRDAAIVVCAEEFSTGSTRLLVSSASASAGGPTIAPGAPCAQALADLFVAGFGVIDVLPFNQQVQYTFVR